VNSPADELLFEEDDDELIPDGKQSKDAVLDNTCSTRFTDTNSYLRTRVNKGNEKNLTAPVLLVPSL
jgi:hypothetical protein